MSMHLGKCYCTGLVFFWEREEGIKEKNEKGGVDDEWMREMNEWKRWMNDFKGDECVSV